MKIKQAITCLLTLFLGLSLSLNASNRKGSGNGWVSSGGDNIPEGQAWFVGSKKIDACLVSNPKFSTSVEDVKKSITKASLIWKNYFTNKVEKNFSNKDLLPQFEIEFNPCSINTELKFYLDSTDADVELAFKKFFDPMGFSVLKEYDHQKMRGVGFMWLSDIFKIDSSLNVEALTSLILHELGHIYGIGHVKDTIMDEKISEFISASGAMAGWPSNNPQMSKMLLSIDQKRPLYFNYYEKFSYEGHIPFDQKNPSTIMLRQTEITSQLFGRNIQGTVKAKLINQGPWVNYHFILSDILGSVDIPIQIHDGTNANGPKLFHVIGLDQNNQSLTQSVSSTYYELFGSIKGQNQKVFSAIITLNMGETYPVRLRVMIDGIPYLLFIEGPPGTYYSR